MPSPTPQGDTRGTTLPNPATRRGRGIIWQKFFPIFGAHFAPNFSDNR